MNSSVAGHVSVLKREVLDILSPVEGDVVLDCTLGLGGHAEAFLEATSPNGRVVGLDADLQNISRAQSRLQAFAKRFTAHHCNFRDVAALAEVPVDVVFADLGLSSPHVDDPERGFTFRASGPLDLRYDRHAGQSAAELLESSSEEQIASILRDFGEIQRSRQLARVLHVQFRSERPSKGWMTNDVVRCVEETFTYRAPKMLPQVFQALRIAVNDELGALQSLLAALPKILKPGGRCGIISYHSLEDRLVKHVFRSLSTPSIDERTGQDREPALFELLTRKSVAPGSGEVAINPRARSARFRALKFRN